MVAARYIEERYLNPLRAKRIKREEEAMKEIREEARAKGLALAQAHAQTLALGHALADARWGAWNERRLAAEAKGEPFDEPTPKPSPSVTPSPTPDGERGTNGGWPLRRRESPSTSPRPPHFVVRIGV